MKSHISHIRSANELRHQMDASNVINATSTMESRWNFINPRRIHVWRTLTSHVKSFFEVQFFFSSAPSRNNHVLDNFFFALMLMTRPLIARLFLLVLGNNDNSWGGQNVRKSYDNYYNNNRGDYQQQQHDGGNKVEQRMQNMRLDSGSHSGGGKQAAEHKEPGPKKMTWATIASQPAKPQISTTSTTVKKKGFGPPPPMIPGKHNMELTDAWDTPKNGPLVPPSPPVIQAPQPELSEKQNNSNFEGQPAWPTPGQAQSQTQNQSQAGNFPTQQQQQPPAQPQQQNNHRGGYHPMNNSQNNYQGHSGRQYNQNSSSGQHQPPQYNSSHHYNDFQKPYHQHPHQMPTAPPQNHQPSAPITRSAPAPPPVVAPTFTAPDATEDSILEQLRVKNQYNPSDLDLSQVDNAR